MPETADIAEDGLLRAMLGAADHVWSVGTLAGVMGFVPSGAGVVPVPGGVMASSGQSPLQSWLRLAGSPRLVAYETISSDPFGWNHAIALCVPGDPPALSRAPIRGPQADADALCAGDRGRPVFDLGIGHAGVSRILLRPAAAEVGRLYPLVGAEWEAAAPRLAGMQGCWIVETPLVRLETETSGEIPLHRLAVNRRGFTHPGTSPIPLGLVPCAHVIPPHPARVRPGLRQAFDADRHRTFQAILNRHGVAGLLALKTRVAGMIAARAPCPPPGVLPSDRHSAATIRVALRQSLALTGEPPPRDWLDRHDPPLGKALA